MVAIQQFLIILLSIFATLSTTTSAFWFSSAPSPSAPAEEPPKSTSRLIYSPEYYRPQYLPPPVPYGYHPYAAAAAAAAAASQAAAIQNVQLVPCLCPVTQEYSHDSIDSINNNNYGSSVRKVASNLAQHQQRRRK